MGTAGVPVSDVSHVANRTIVKWIALYVPGALAAWDPTRPEIDQVRGGGTTPAQFDDDVTALVALLAVVGDRPRNSSTDAAIRCSAGSRAAPGCAGAICMSTITCGSSGNDTDYRGRYAHSGRQLSE